MRRRLCREDYTIGWVCALSIELAAAQEMLDEEHEDFELTEDDDHDKNLYSLGSIAGHNVAIVCLPAGRIGNSRAAVVATQLHATFKSLRYTLMVGVGGGVPSSKADIRLGDVVISQPCDGFAGVIQYDRGKSTPSGFQRTGSQNSPPDKLLAVVARIQAYESRGRSNLSEHLSNFEQLPRFRRNKTCRDVLFSSAYNHKSGQNCGDCSVDYELPRVQREVEGVPVVHYGTIASGNQVIKDGCTRDKLSRELGDVLCFDMEAAGLMNSFPCLVIRGICDYADSHKNKSWQPYAAAVAAAYAKQVLLVIPARDIQKRGRVEETTCRANEQDPRIESSHRPKRRQLSSLGNSGNGTVQTNDLAQRSQIMTVESEDIVARYFAHTNGASTPAHNSTIHQDCLKALSFPEQLRRHEDIHTAKDTCQWLLEHPQYRHWVKVPQGLLWIKGNPGVGKSVLMKYAAKAVLHDRPIDFVASFFIHGQGNELQRSLLGVYRALLHSLLAKFPEHLSHLTEYFEEQEHRFGGHAAGRWSWTEQKLQRLLTDFLVHGAQNRAIILFIDALDECGKEPAQEILRYFRDLLNDLASTRARIKICVSSRHYPIIGLDQSMTVIVEDQNYEDIKKYTNDRLKDILPASKRKEMVQEILAKAQGAFQWVYLVTEMVLRKDLEGVKADKLLQALKSCPKTLSSLYKATLNAETHAERFEMAKLFRWILFAGTPLSMQELREAIALDLGVIYTSITELRSHENWSDDLKAFERRINTLSRGLIRFQTREVYEQYVPEAEGFDKEAQFIHQSAADYILDEFLVESVVTDPASSSQAGVGHFQISRSCLKYLVIDEVLEGAGLLRGPLSYSFPLAPYAVRFLFEHMSRVESERITQQDLLSIIRWSPQSHILRRLDNLLKILDPDNAHIPKGWPFAQAKMFHFLAAIGSKSAFIAFLEQRDDDIGGKDSDQNTPLMIAIRGGHYDLAKAMLDLDLSSRGISTYNSAQHSLLQRKYSVDVNAENADGDTALTIALPGGFEALIVKLIEAGADLKYMWHESMFIANAISNMSMLLVQIAIDKKINLDGAVYFAVEELATSRNGDLESLITMLLNAGANTLRSPSLLPLMETEGYEGHEDSEGEDVYAGDATLLVACKRGLTRVVEMLLSHGVSTACRNSAGQSPLYVAIETGHVEIAELLSKQIPGVGSLIDDEGDNPFNEAFIYGDMRMVHLLQNGYVLDALGSSLQSLLWKSAGFGFLDAVRHILQSDKIDPDRKDGWGRTTLSLAAISGREDIVALLLATKKVSVNSRDVDGKTPMFHAAEGGHTAVISMLLRNSATDVNISDKDGQTPLARAAELGCHVTVALLLEKDGIEIHSTSNDYQSALAKAADAGNESVVKLLLDKGVHSMPSQLGFRAWLLAARNGHKPVEELLYGIGIMGSERTHPHERDVAAAQHLHNFVAKVASITYSAVVVGDYHNFMEDLMIAAFNEDHSKINKLLEGNIKAHSGVIRDLHGTSAHHIKYGSLYQKALIWLTMKIGHDRIKELFITALKTSNYFAMVLENL